MATSSFFDTFRFADPEEEKRYFEMLKLTEDKKIEIEPIDIITSEEEIEKYIQDIQIPLKTSIVNYQGNYNKSASS